MTFISFVWLIVLFLLLLLNNLFVKGGTGATAVAVATLHQLLTLVIATGIVMWAYQAFQAIGAFGPITIK